MKNVKNKICFVVSSVSTARVFLRDHIEALSLYYDVYLIGSFNDDDISLIAELKVKGSKSIEIERKLNPLKDILSVFQLWRYLKKNEFLATHSVTPKAGLVTALASFMAGVPYRVHIFTGQVWHTRHGLMKWILKMIDRLIAILNTNILIDGESQKQFLILNRIIKDEKSIVLGKGSISGVNINRFKPEEKVRVKMRSDLQIENKIVFGFLGRLNYDKGIVDLFDAYNKLCKERNDIFLILVGVDEENMLSLLPSFSYIVESVNFKYLGSSNEPESILQVFDVFCLPSYREGFGTSVLEASCLGIPVICSDTYGLMDAMVDGVTGLRHKVGQSQDLYQKMKQIAENEEARLSMGDNARKFVIENFSGEMITNEWVKYYMKFRMPASK